MHEKNFLNRKYLWAVVVAVMIYLCINILAHFLYVPLKCFFMDDIALLLQFQDENILTYLLHGHDNKFRPVSDFFLYIGYKIFDTDTANAYIYILAVGAVSCGIVCYLTIKLMDSIWFGLCVSICLSISRFAYYAVGQYFGIMESISMINAIFTLYYGISFVISDEKIEKKKYLLMNLFALMCIFSHERYMTIYGFLFGVVFVKYLLKRDSFKYYVGIVTSAAAMWIFRFIYLGNGALQGTGGSNLVEELDISRVISFLWDGVLLVFGWNAGEAYLNGIAIEKVRTVYNIIPFAILLIFVVLIIINVTDVLKKKEYSVLKVMVAFFFFECVTLFSGCITIRLETRWIYIPYVGFMVFIFYMLSRVDLKKYNLKYHKEIISSVLLCCAMIMEFYFRPYWQDNYLGAEFDKYNSVYDIVEGYKDEIYGRPVVIIENIYNGVKVIDSDVINRMFAAYCNKGIVNWNYINSFSEIDEAMKDKNPIIIYVEWQKNPNIWRKEIFDVTNLYNYGK